MIVDSGTTGTYLGIHCPTTEQHPTKNPISIKMPDGDKLTSTHEALINLPPLNRAARRAHIVPGLSHCNLLSVGQLCDAGYTVTFDAQFVYISDPNETILQGSRCELTGLYYLNPSPFRKTTPHDESTHNHASNAAIGAPSTPELVAFAHATLFSPTLSTLENALLKGHLTNFPGLSVTSLRRFPPKSIATVKGHQDQTRKNQRSTKQPALLPDDSVDSDAPKDADIDIPIDHRSHHCYAAIFEPTGQIYSDQTGRFVSPSSNGNNYIMVVYDYDSNFLFAQPFPRRTKECILKAFQTVHKRLVQAGLRPKLQRLDNECSDILKQFMSVEGIDYQLVPPAVHRRNAAERAIRTFKNHFIAGLCSVDPEFPLHLWDQLIPQAEITLNLTRTSRINPKLSAWAQLHGTFDFNRTPLGPPGSRVVVHDKPANRTSWAPHGLDGYYLGPALESYRCYRVWIRDTRKDRIADTVAWFPKYVQLPSSSTADRIAASLQDIVTALKQPSPATPLAPLTDSQHQALLDITALLTNICPKPETVHEEPSPTTTPLPSPATPLPSPVPEPAPNEHDESRLRVPIVEPTDEPFLRVPLVESDKVPPDQPTTATPLKVAATNAPVSPPRAAHGPKATNDALAQDAPTPRRSNKSPTLGTYSEAVRKKARPQKQAPNKTPSRNPRRQRTTNKQRRSTRVTHPKPIFDPSANMASSPDLPIEHWCCHGTAINPDTGRVAEYAELSQSSDGPQWQESNAEEIGRLFQGLGPDSHMPKGSDTCFFIKPHQLPKGKNATYIRVVCADRPEKKNPRRVRWTAGGNLVTYPYSCSTKTADVSTCKTMLNSVISQRGRRYMTMDLSDFYLSCVLDIYEYVRVPTHLLPPHIWKIYNLDESYVRNGHIYVEVRRGMYGLPQAGKLANVQLQAFLEPHGYKPCTVTPGLWKDENSSLMFTLVVDDFGVRYDNKSQADKLLQVLQKKYRVSCDWTGARYIGLTINWDYINGTVDISMPGYINRALQRFGHTKPKRPEHSPHEWTTPNYGARQQYATTDSTPFIDIKQVRHVQEVVGTLLYYARAVDSTMLAALGTIATQQASATEATLYAVTRILNYCSTNPAAIIRYTASDMQLYVESDASYLSESKARSRAAGYFYLSKHRRNPNKPPLHEEKSPPANGAIHVLSNIMRDVVTSAAEAELGALFYNGKEAVPIRACLIELGHPQAPTPMVTDNQTASGIANDSVKQKRSKAMDMRFYWIRDRVRKGQFYIYWRKGADNKADYFTKHHPVQHVKSKRYEYLHDPATPVKNYYDVLSDTAPNSQLYTVQTDCGEGVLNIDPADATVTTDSAHAGQPQSVATPLEHCSPKAHQP